MAPDDTDQTQEEGQEESPPKKGKLKLIIIIVVALLVIGGGAASYFIFFSGDAKTAAEDGGDTGENGADGGEDGDLEDGELSTKKSAAESIVYGLDVFIVNVYDAEGILNYLKLEVKLELDSKEAEDEATDKTAKIRDHIITIVTNKTIDEIKSKNGKARLKDEIKARINSFLVTGKATEVYFTEFIIQ